MNLENIVFLTGTSVPLLAKKTLRHLPIRNAKLSKATVAKFSDGELNIELLESVRGSEAYIIQSTCFPCNDTLMEIMFMSNALQLAGVEKITAVIPYFGYARQDRRPGHSRTAISGKVAARMLTGAGVSRVIVMDIHSEQTEGFFDCSVTNLSASSLFLADVRKNYKKKDMENLIGVAPDVGSVARSRKIVEKLNIDLAIIDKRRPKANASEVMNLIGDVEGKHCVMFDDMIDTAGTLCKGAEALKEHGALSVVAYATHPVLSGPAYENINNSVIDRVVVTDTIPLRPDANCDRIEVISVAELLSKAISRMLMNGSLGALDSED